MNQTVRKAVRLLVPAPVCAVLLAAAISCGDRGGFTKAERAILDVPDHPPYALRGLV